MTSGADEHGSPEVPLSDEPQETTRVGQSPAAPQPGSAGDVIEGDVTDADVNGATAGPTAGAGQAASLESDLADARKAVADLTGDLQRLQAEFLNYKRRVDRDRDLVRQNATFAVLSPMLDVLDAIDRAREHGELEGGFKVVADQLERAVAGLGLTRFGKPGDPFDPALHDALSHIGTSADVDTVTCQHIVKAGYRFGDRVVRAAQVIVVDPEETTSAAVDTAVQEPVTQDADVPVQE